MHAVDLEDQTLMEYRWLLRRSLRIVEYHMNERTRFYIKIWGGENYLCVAIIDSLDSGVTRTNVMLFLSIK